MNRIFLVTTSAAFLLNGCGGSGTPSNNITGKVIDGYVSGAKVFWDCNTNGLIDANEIATTSNIDGVYSISPQPKSGCRLTAYIPANAIDADTGAIVLSSYAMYALDENSSIISPLTTLAVLDNSTSDQKIAVESIKSAFEIKINIDDDYISQITDDHILARKFAKVTAQLLQSSYSEDAQYEKNINKSIIDTLSSIKSSISSAKISDIVYRKISLPNIANRATRIFYADQSLGVKVVPFDLNEDQILYLNQVINDPKVTPHIGGGQIDWAHVDLATLTQISAHLGNLGFNSSEVIALQEERNLKRSSIAENYKALHSDAVKFVTLDAETISSIIDVADATLKGGYGVAKMASVAPNISGVFANLNMTPGSQGKLIRNLDKLSKYTGFMAKAKECGFSIDEWREVFSQTEIAPENYLKTIRSASSLIGCLGSLIDEQPSGKSIQYVVGIFKGGAESVDDQFEGIMTLLDTLNIAISLTPPTPFSNAVSGFIDVMSAGVSSYKAGITINEQADKRSQVLMADIDAAFDSKILTLNRIYQNKIIRAQLENRIVREDWIVTSPKITGFTPLSATAGSPTTFTVTGTNLPVLNNLSISFDGCSNLNFGTKSTTSHTFTCTPIVTGAASAVIREKADTAALGKFSLMVTAAAPVCVAPQILQGGACVTPTLFSDDFNGIALDSSKWTSAPCLSAGDPTFAGNGQVHFGSCQSASTQGKVTFSGKKIVIEARFAGPKGAGRDTAIALVNAATGDFFQFGDTDYFGRGIYAYLYYGGSYEFVQPYGGTTTAFKEYRVTIEGKNVTIQRGDSLSNLTETYTATLPRSATDGAYYLRIGTGTDWYAPADFDWINVYTDDNYIINVDAKKFTAASMNIAVDAGSLYACRAGIVGNAPPWGEQANSGVWTVNAPAAGTYLMEANYAALESRPLKVSVNDAVVTASALSNVTGGWCLGDAKTYPVGVVTLKAGANTLRLDRASVFPHLVSFRFTRQQ